MTEEKKHRIKKAAKAAFPVTIPVLFGYLSIGLAFGLLLSSIGYHFIWAFFMSLLIYSGSMQYFAVQLMSVGAGFFNVALMTLFINNRYALYGLSFIEKFKKMGKLRWYMIYSLTDETYALLCSQKPPKDVDENLYAFFISIMDHSYWIIGSVLGALIGSLIHFNTTGVDFAMTALFTVICVEQWESTKYHSPAMVGTICSILALIIFKSTNMMIPAIIGIIVTLLCMRKKLEGEEALS